MKKFFGDNKASANISRHSLRGGVFSIAGRAVNAIVQVLSVIVLARLLSPEDYGLVSMVGAIIGIAPLLIDLGTRDAVIQQPEISPGEMSALFWITTAIGCGFATIIAAGGPLIARFYHEPRLTNIAILSSLSLVAAALSYQHQGLLRRAMQYKALAVIDIFSNLVSTICALALAYYGWGYWALVVRPIITNIVVVVGVWSQCPWIPGRPTFTTGVSAMIRYGLHCIGFSSVDFVGKFGDRVALGRVQGATNLGFYQKACLVYDNSLDLMVTPLHTVAMTGLSKLRDNVALLLDSWSRALSTLAFYAMPAFGLLSVTSRDLITVVLGAKWETASILLSILALRGIPHVIERTVGWLYAAAGRPDRFMRWGVIAAIAQLIALFAGLPFGAIGVSWAYVVCMYLLFIPAISISGKQFGIGPKQILRIIGPQMLGALIAVGLGYLLRWSIFINVPKVPRILLLTASYLLTYGLIVLGLFRVRIPLIVTRSVFHSFVKKAHVT
jgi:polysaccharide transporter, PST family